MNNKPKSKTILEELRGEGSESSIPLTEINRSPVASTQRQGGPHHSSVGKWCAKKGSEVSEIREGCDHGFQNF